MWSNVDMEKAALIALVVLALAIVLVLVRISFGLDELISIARRPDVSGHEGPHHDYGEG